MDWPDSKRVQRGKADTTKCEVVLEFLWADSDSAGGVWADSEGHRSLCSGSGYNQRRVDADLYSCDVRWENIRQILPEVVGEPKQIGVVSECLCNQKDAVTSLPSISQVKCA